MDLCLLCTRLRSVFGKRNRAGVIEIKDKRFLDVPSAAVTRRLLASAKLWILIRAAMEDYNRDALEERDIIDSGYIEKLRAQFMQDQMGAGDSHSFGAPSFLEYFGDLHDTTLS